MARTHGKAFVGLLQCFPLSILLRQSPILYTAKFSDVFQTICAASGKVRTQKRNAWLIPAGDVGTLVHDQRAEVAGVEHDDVSHLRGGVDVHERADEDAKTASEVT